MPMYRAKVTCFVDNGIRNEGDVFEYNGPPNSNLERADGKSDDAEAAPKAQRKAKADDAVQA
jgi:hypothetical protein